MDPPPDLANRRDDVLGDQRRAHDVDVQHGPPFLGRCIDAFQNEDCCIIHQNWIDPNAETAWAAICLTLVSSETSVCTKSACPPAFLILSCGVATG